MNNLNIADYGRAQDGIQYGMENAQNVDLLNKALQALQVTGRDTTDRTDESGAPLKVESLNKTLKHLTFRESDIVLWKNLPKKSAFNTVEEYNQQSTYGEIGSAFNLEGELPSEKDSIFIRRAQLVKYLGVVKSVTHQMTLVNTMIGNVMEKAVKDGTMWILRELDHALYYGDSHYINEQFNGYLAQHFQAIMEGDSTMYFHPDNYYKDTSIVIDARNVSGSGKYGLQEEHIEDAANILIENYAQPTQFYTAPKVLSDFVKNFYGNKFIVPNSPSLTDGIMGQRVQSFMSQFGNIGLNADIFYRKPIRTKGWKPVSNITLLPDDPTVAVSANTGTGIANTTYAITAYNRYGETKLVLASAMTSAAASVDITPTKGSKDNTTGFRIYRTMDGMPATYAAITDTTPFYLIADVSYDDLKNGTVGINGAAKGSFRDTATILPGTNEAFLCQFDTEVIEFAQLAPLMKMDLATLAPAFRFMILLYGTPFLYAPRKMVRIINIQTVGNTQVKQNDI